jgi:rRNA-processing protein FCF1
MPPDRLRLKQGVAPAHALKVLREAARVCRALGNSNPDAAFNDYRAWVEGTEPQLASVTRDPTIVTMLLTQRHFLIQEIGPNPLRLWGPLYAERDLQAAALDALADDIEMRIARAAGDGQPAVIDTNVLLHYQRPDSVPWPKVLGRISVRLVVPLRVVEELDEKKYGRSDALATRAREVLPWIEEAILSKAGKIREDTTIEVPIGPERRIRPENADREIVDECHELREFGAHGVMLVTGDTSMRLRAHAESIPTAPMPDTWLRNPPRGSVEAVASDV